MNIVSDMSSPTSYPGGNAGSFYSHNIRNDIQPPVPTENVDSTEVDAANENNEG